MKVFIAVLLLAIGLTAVGASAKVVRGYDTLLKDRNINFSTGVIGTNNVGFTKIFGSVHSCADTVPSIDFFVSTLSVTMCICNDYIIHAVGSPRPLYKSKNSFSSMNFSQQLRLDDTSRFEKIDTQHTPTFPGRGTAKSDSAVCGLPHYVPQTSDSNCFFIVRTTDKKYAVVQALPVFSSWSNPSPMPSPPITFISGYRLKWFVQTDGSLNFPGINTNEIKPHSIPKQIQLSSSRTHLLEGSFNIQGRRIQSGGKNVAGLTIHQDRFGRASIQVKSGRK